MINDISAGLLDENMLPVVGELKVPLCNDAHAGNTPRPCREVPIIKILRGNCWHFLRNGLLRPKRYGVEDLIIDPGFGFGKHRHTIIPLLTELQLFTMLGLPVMVGLSRKSMIYKSLHITPEEALNGTTVLNTLALNNGATLLRVHDVKEASEVIRLFTLYQHAAKIIG